MSRTCTFVFLVILKTYDKTGFYDVERMLFFLKKGGDGMEFCPDCGAQLIHAEGCVMCSCCGWSRCECSACSGKEVGSVQSIVE